jgi:cytoskeletal protein CcmA (bactofilin family)
MFKKKSKNLLDAVETLVGRNAVLEGTIKTDKVMRIDGKIKGDIDASGVLIGTEAEVIGDINTKIIVVCGLVEGNINASETIEIMPKAKVVGDIKTNILTIAEGAYFDGKSSMITKEIGSGAEKK